MVDLWLLCKFFLNCLVFKGFLKLNFLAVSVTGDRVVSFLSFFFFFFFFFFLFLIFSRLIVVTLLKPFVV
jgi:hypothetical protein